MNITYDDGRTEELVDLMNKDVHEKLERAMQDPAFREAIVRRQAHSGLPALPKKDAPLSTLRQMERDRP